ncbi:hypothetical protein Tco_0009140 [Tanacetum coccineum]
MQVIIEEFMELSSEVVRRLKERIKENENKPRKIEKITKYPDTKAMSKRSRSTRGQASPSHNETMEEKVRKFVLFDNEDHQINYNTLAGCSIHSGHVVDWEFLSDKVLAQSYDPLHKGVTNIATLSGLRKAETVNSTRETHSIWPSIGDDMFNVGNIKAQSIRSPRIKLAHRCITMTITGRKETTNRVTEIDFFYLYCIFGEGVVCNIPYWLSKYLKGVRDKAMIFGGDPPPHVYRKKSLVKMGVIMELHEGVCCWPATREVVEENKGDDEEGDEEGGNKGVGGSTNVYRNMSVGEWQVHQAQWMGQQDDRWGKLDTWMEQQDQRAHWMYDHTVRQFQHLLTRDNLEPHLQIDPFPAFEANYPPYGYHGHMPPGYSYRPDPSHDGSS